MEPAKNGRLSMVLLLGYAVAGFGVAFFREPEAWFTKPSAWLAKPVVW